MDRFQQLLDAIADDHSPALSEYLGSHPTNIIKEDLLRLMEMRLYYPLPADLKDFTMAAMQGLCSGVNICELTTNEVVSIAYSAADIAERTLIRLSELQKQQS